MGLDNQTSDVVLSQSKKHIYYYVQKIFHIINSITHYSNYSLESKITRHLIVNWFGNSFQANKNIRIWEPFG